MNISISSIGAALHGAIPPEKKILCCSRPWPPVFHRQPMKPVQRASRSDADRPSKTSKPTGFQAGRFPALVDMADEVQQLPPHGGVGFEGQVMEFRSQAGRGSVQGDVNQIGFQPYVPFLLFWTLTRHLGSRTRAPFVELLGLNPPGATEIE